MYSGTLLHEGSHFLLALKHFLLQMSHGHQYCSYLCKRRGQRRQGERLTPVDIMEIQANKLPGYLMIDEESGKRKAEELLGRYPSRGIESMTGFVRDMAEYFGTTQTLARTRLEAMGFRDVRGILRSANGKIVPAYFSDLRDNQTYIIDHSDALKEYIANPEFRAVLDSGRYIYCEGHFCLKHPQYVKIDHMGHPHLTPYAREHMRESCLVFETVYGHVLRLLLNGVLQKGRGGEKRVRYVTQDGASPITAEGQAFRRMIMQEYNLATQVEASFNDRIVKLMEAIRLRPCAEHISRNEMGNCARWVFRRSQTSWYRKRCVWCWKRSMSRYFYRHHMAFVRIGVVIQPSKTSSMAIRVSDGLLKAISKASSTISTTLYWWI